MMRPTRIYVTRMVPDDVTLFDVPSILNEQEGPMYTPQQLERRLAANHLMTLVEECGMEAVMDASVSARRAKDVELEEARDAALGRHKR